MAQIHPKKRHLNTTTPLFGLFQMVPTDSTFAFRNIHDASMAISLNDTRCVIVSLLRWRKVAPNDIVSYRSLFLWVPITVRHTCPRRLGNMTHFSLCDMSHFRSPVTRVLSPIAPNHTYFITPFRFPIAPLFMSRTDGEHLELSNTHRQNFYNNGTGRAEAVMFLFHMPLPGIVHGQYMIEKPGRSVLLRSTWLRLLRRSTWLIMVSLSCSFLHLLFFEAKRRCDWENGYREHKRINELISFEIN